MDLKSKSRTWVGNIYHKFEAMCQEVDDFVTKDTVKYVENQVQTVGESVKKLYSNVVHDFHAPLGDNEQAKAQTGNETQNDGVQTNIRSMVGIKQKHRPASEREPSKEQDKVDLRRCNASQVDHLGQFSPPHSADSHQVEETDSLWKARSDAATENNAEVFIEENAAGEDYEETSYLSSPKYENSSELALYGREQRLLTDNLWPSVDGNFSGPSDISNDGDQRNIIPAGISPRNLVDGVETDLSEKAGTGLFLKTEIGAEENAAVEEHPASELTSSLCGKNSWELLWTQEEDPAGYDFYALEAKSSSIRSSADEDHKFIDLVKCSPEILVPETVVRVVLVEQEANSNADPAEKAVTDLSLQHNGCVGLVKRGMDLVENAKKEHLVVDNRSYPSYESSCDLSLHPREKHPKAEDPSSLQGKSLCKSSSISTNEHSLLTVLAKVSPETSVNDEGIKVFEEEEQESNRLYCSNETETDLSLDGYCSCMSSDFGVEENGFMEKRALPEYLGCSEHKRSCESHLSSGKLLVETDDFNSPNVENSSGVSLISRTEDHKSTISPKFSPVNSVSDAGLRAFQKDDTTCNNFSDVLRTNLSSDLVSSDISWEYKVAEIEASSCSLSTELLDLLEFSHANCTQKTQEVCCDHTDSGGCSSVLSSISCASISGLTSGNKAVNLIPTFPSTAGSADTSRTNESMFESSGNKHQHFFEGIVDGCVNDIADADMETIDLSDKAKLEESCVVVDNELLYAASCRPRKFRSYRKLIQEAFASRKRLIKEYEQLSIWYGDIDTDTSFHAEQCLSPHTPSASRPSQPRDLGESEWELL